MEKLFKRFYECVGERQGKNAIRLSRTHVVGGFFFFDSFFFTTEKEVKLRTFGVDERRLGRQVMVMMTQVVGARARHSLLGAFEGWVGALVLICNNFLMEIRIDCRRQKRRETKLSLLNCSQRLQLLSLLVMESSLHYYYTTRTLLASTSIILLYPTHKLDLFTHFCTILITAEKTYTKSVYFVFTAV